MRLGDDITDMEEAPEWARLLLGLWWPAVCLYARAQVMVRRLGCRDRLGLGASGVAMGKIAMGRVAMGSPVDGLLMTSAMPYGIAAGRADGKLHPWRIGGRHILAPRAWGLHSASTLAPALLVWVQRWSRKQRYRLWRRLFRVYLDYDRTRRGDRPLPKPKGAAQPAREREPPLSRGARLTHRYRSCRPACGT